MFFDFMTCAFPLRLNCYGRAFWGVVEQPAGMGHGHAHTAVASGNTKGLASIFLPRCGMNTNGFIGADAHCVGHSVDNVGAASHGG